MKLNVNLRKIVEEKLNTYVNLVSRKTEGTVRKLTSVPPVKKI